MATNDTDLGLTLGCSDSSNVHSFLNSRSGVGVNARTGVNMPYIASEPLFELVWCPNKGLTLKSADYSVNRNSSSPISDRLVNERKLKRVEEMIEGHLEAGKDDNLSKSTDQEYRRTTDKPNLPSLFIGNPELALDKLDSASGYKGKEKESALLDIETNKKRSKHDGDDNTSESMESCSSVGFSKGNKRWRFEQNSVVGTKRIKKQIPENSFMNWIATMLKGVPDSNQDVDPTKIITSNKTYESKITNEDRRRMLDGDQTCGGDIVFCNSKKPLLALGCSTDLIWHGKIVSEKQNLCFEEIQNPKVPKGMFDAMNKLRLSRTDIIRWKNSHIPISNLDGFFVRLRLGKSQGLGETSYQVASVNGLEQENLPMNSKNPISVKIGDINCVVESQYVSNHDFLEDELTAWWEITSKTEKMPTEEEMKTKLEARMKFGF